MNIENDLNYSSLISVAIIVHQYFDNILTSRQEKLYYKYWAISNIR